MSKVTETKLSRDINGIKGNGKPRMNIAYCVWENGSSYFLAYQVLPLSLGSLIAAF